MAPREIPLSLQEAADLADVSLSTASRAAQSGELIAVRKGERGRWYVLRSDAEAWANTRKHPPCPRCGYVLGDPLTHDALTT